jgi:hypothetical protein
LSCRAFSQRLSSPTQTTTSSETSATLQAKLLPLSSLYIESQLGNAELASVELLPLGMDENLIIQHMRCKTKKTNKSQTNPAQEEAR